MIKISFIIPVYNVENYLEECITSILNQFDNDIEVIIINDGSTDNSKTICEKYEKLDERIKFYDQSNSGVSYTRNKALKYAKGKYIMFVDSDDYVSDNFSIEISNFLNDDYDLIAFGYDKVYLNKKISYLPSINYSDKKLFYHAIFDDDCVAGYLPNKLFKRDIIINNNLFLNEKIAYCEDLLFCFNYMKFVNKIKIIDSSFYNYRMRNGSITNCFDSHKYISLFLALNTIYYETNDLYVKNRISIFYLDNYVFLKKYLNNFVDKEKYINSDILIKEKEIVKMNGIIFIFKFYLKKYIPKIFRILKKISKYKYKCFE